MTNTTRRKFLALASGSVVAASLIKPTAAAIPKTLVRGSMQLGIQMYSLRGFDVDTALKHAATTGFQQVEFYKGMLAVDATSEEITAIKQKVASHGLTLSAHGVNRFTSDRTANEGIFKFAKELGIKNLTADPDPESFDQLNDLVKQYDIRIAIHNHGPRHRYNKVVDVLRAIEKYDERIGACADLGHYIRSGEQPIEVIRLLKGRLYGIHLKDFAEMKDKAEGVILGKGHLDVDGVMDALMAVDFPADGALSLEYEENPKDPIEDIRACQKIAAAAIEKATKARS